MLAALVTVIVGLVCTFYAYYKWQFSFWQRRGLPSLPATIPFGSLPNPLKRKDAVGLDFKNKYQEMRNKGWRHGCLYFLANPVYWVLDIEYLKNVLTKDFQHFVDRGVYYNEKDDPISAHLFAIGGIKWKNLRAKLTPTFTSGKMKMMYPTLVECLAPMSETMDKFYKNDEPVNIKEVLGCFTTNIIGSCAFGLEFNTFSEENSPFRVYGKKVFSNTRLQQLKFAFISNFPEISRKLRLRGVKQDVSDFFTEVVRKTIDYREKNNYRRPDFMQILIDMKSKTGEDYNHDGKSLTFGEIVAQAFIFFLAGFETSSTTMTFALYELASNQEIQDKVRQEINEVLKKHNGEITYEALLEMKYMGQVIDETLRKYPPVPFITRSCVKDYKFPDCDLVIPKGMRIGIPVMGIHYDPEYWPEPEKFDPDRFTEENKQTRNPYTHIPFGEGPRVCIGLRFGVMQTKCGLASLLRSYKFTVSKKTETPLEFDHKSFVLAAKGDVWLDLQKI